MRINDWSSDVCSSDLVNTPLDQAQIDFENGGGETYICGNPPYLGSTWQDEEQKSDLQALFAHRAKSWKSLDYVAGWLIKAADYATHRPTLSAFVSTNSICQGRQDRKSAVVGKKGTVRVELGGCRTINKKKTN